MFAVDCQCSCTLVRGHTLYDFNPLKFAGLFCETFHGHLKRMQSRCCRAQCSKYVTKAKFVYRVAQVFIFTDLLSESLFCKLPKDAFEIFNHDNGFAFPLSSVSFYFACFRFCF